MKNIHYTLALCGMFAIASCSKSSDKTGSNDSFDYTISPVDNVTLKMNANTSLPVQVKKVSGTTEMVSLAVSGLPANVTAAFNSIEAEPDFTTQLNILVQGNATVGSYPVKIVGLSKSGVSHEQLFTLNVKNENCALDMVGTWQGNSTCQSTNFVSNVTADPLYPYHFTINNFGNTGLNVDGTIDCNTGKVTLSSKSNSSIGVDDGTGTYTDNNMTINYTLSAPGTHMSCAATYTR